jgi:hypothetical protein
VLSYSTNCILGHVVSFPLHLNNFLHRGTERKPWAGIHLRSHPQRVIQCTIDLLNLNGVNSEKNYLRILQKLLDLEMGLYPNKLIS